MTIVIVMLPIEVPSGKYCWDSQAHEICEHFSNDGGHPVCNLDLGNLNHSEDGRVVKSRKCSELVELKPDGKSYVSMNGKLVAVPKKVWKCLDCGTISDEKTSHLYHVGCVGEVFTVNKKFAKMREPSRSRNGEIVWTMIAPHKTAKGG